MTRADALDAAVNVGLDRLDASGVDPQNLDRSGVLVRAFFTFSPRAETISAESVKRLAQYHATIWVDTTE